MAELYQQIARSMDLNDNIAPVDDKIYYIANLKILNDDLDDAYQCLYERLFRSDFSDTDTLKALVARVIAIEEESILSEPVDSAIDRIMAHTCENYAADEYIEGFAYLEFLKQVSEDLEEDPERVAEKLGEVVSAVNNRYQAASVYAGNEEGIRRFKTASENFFKEMPYEERSDAKRDYDIANSREAFIYGGDMNYNTVGASYEELGIDQNGSMKVITRMVRDQLLLPQLRFTKGAYDTANNANLYGMYTLSYRDPQLKDTYDYYEQVGSQIRELDLTDETLEGYIARTFVDLVPNRGLLFDTWNTLSTMIYNPEENQKTYENLKEILNTTMEDVKASASVYDALAENGAKCTVGKESDIIANADLFDEIYLPFDDGTIRLYIDGRQVSSEMPPVIEGDSVLVPLGTIADAFGASVSRNKDEDNILVTYDNRMNVLHVSSDKMITEGREIALDGSPELIDDQILVPLSVVREIFNRSADWKGDCVIMK
jgi:Zn-dependent M16 (insulinase) family peptidase